MLSRSIAIPDRTADRPAATGSQPSSSPCDRCRYRRTNFCGVLIDDGPSHGLAIKRHHSKGARQTIQRGGEDDDGVIVLCEGWAIRFVQLPNGKRQILSIVLPGDLVSAAAAFDPDALFSVQAVTAVRYRYYDKEYVRSRIESDRDDMRAWLKIMTAEQRDADMHRVDLGQRTAQERVAALFLRLAERFEARDHAPVKEFPFPLRQQQVGDLTGLTPVHVCRVLNVLRNEHICEVSAGVVQIHNRSELERLAASR